jgi:hypothetical protein
MDSGHRETMTRTPKALERSQALVEQSRVLIEMSRTLKDYFLASRSYAEEAKRWQLERQTKMDRTYE